MQSSNRKIKARIILTIIIPAMLKSANPEARKEVLAPPDILPFRLASISFAVSAGYGYEIPNMRPSRPPENNNNGCSEKKLKYLLLSAVWEKSARLKKVYIEMPLADIIGKIDTNKVPIQNRFPKICVEFFSLNTIKRVNDSTMTNKSPLLPNDK